MHKLEIFLVAANYKSTSRRLTVITVIRGTRQYSAQSVEVVRLLA